MQKIILDWNRYLETSRRAAAEGCVLLENNGALPLDKNAETAVFGRIQSHYYKSGTGSGGMVNVSRVWSIVDGLKECGAALNAELERVYENWEKENPCSNGDGWGGEPWSQEEMPVSDELAARVAETAETALVIIGRTAGEEKDSAAEEGSYLLTAVEMDVLKTVRKHFKKMAVVLNVGGIIDMGFVREIAPDAVLYAWQGGMIGGLAAADVLLGNVSPCGKLSDTIAANIADYPSHPYFGDKLKNFYTEDIYVGYRWFETFAKDKVLYPFGFGRSYTDFKICTEKAETVGEKIIVETSVENVGKHRGKEVVQLYCGAPQGKLGKAARVLCAYEKTKELALGEKQTLRFEVELSSLASYDDCGATGYKSCYVLEAGEYKIYAGADVRSAEFAYGFEIAETRVTERCTEAYAPVEKFDIIKNIDGRAEKAAVHTAEVDMEVRRAENLPAEIKYTGDKGIKLADVLSGKNSMEQFVAQLSDGDLACIIRGEGMGSPQVTAGTAAAFGGVTERLRKFGIPCGCCDDGPSGMRLDCGTKAFSLPIGTMLACTFNKELVEELFTLTGIEMSANNVECLLGPGMNIHRHPLNGRNFEYFSEDPFLTGTIAAAELTGLHKSGVTGTVKHFCGNNQEVNRRGVNSVISERALREIYLKGFEIAVKKGKATSVMTTYGAVNGLWTASSYDLNTTVLRGEWGFEGIVMTDWWSTMNERGKAPSGNNFAAMARAQNDLYMVCADSSKNTHGDNTLEALAEGTLTRGELQRCAKNICNFLMHSRVMERLLGTAAEIEVINRPADAEDFDGGEVEFFKIDRSGAVPLESVEAVKGKSFAFALDVSVQGKYRVTVTAKAEGGEVAQVPVTLFVMGSPCGTFTFNGTGEWREISREMPMFSRFVACRLYFGQSGLTLRDIRLELVDENFSWDSLAD
ncbi:MAG: glycoside hydrolase family 3 C-terminal domain-containing protein [Ruminococcus sp.]|nr:glycoside hydrolase family 3 C-terminal domain-containing protein [Ruminococcus sp.]MCM1380795.1 glycoside hydrolase family 3 C-terminal domain-containing protein [Muribaculaceae bacterium]MCM1478488.1 glycoside hydrolase family 3 C-terminal domain-containing protein [Muribaculaceae bacterium]